MVSRYVFPERIQSFSLPVSVKSSFLNKCMLAVLSHGIFTAS